MIKVQKDLDELLGDGLLPGVLTHIYGPPASGKTNIALIATANAARHGKVIYIDPEGGFSIERLKQIAGDKTEEILKNVLLVEPATFDEQKVAIYKLDTLVPKSNATLVVIDSIAMLYRLEEDKDIREMGRLLARLLRIARRYEIPVLMLNQVYTDIESGDIVSVGGTIHKYWSKVMIELGIEEDRRFALLKKHLFRPEGMRMEFRIVESGIETISCASRS